MSMEMIFVPMGILVFWEYVPLSKTPSVNCKVPFSTKNRLNLKSKLMLAGV